MIHDWTEPLVEDFAEKYTMPYSNRFNSTERVVYLYEERVCFIASSWNKSAYTWMSLPTGKKMTIPDEDFLNGKVRVFAYFQ